MLSGPRTTSASAKFSPAIINALAAAARRRCALAAAALLAAALFASALVPAAGAAEKPLRDPEVIGDINRIEKYLNGIRSIQSRFIQINSDGSDWQGELYVQRPGKFRFEYDPPVPHLLIANGSWLFHVDKRLKETNIIPLLETPASFLVRDDISFRNGLKVTKFDRAPGILKLSMVTKDNPDLGEVTLTFTDQPLELRKWSIRDAQDNYTHVTLQNARFGGTLKPDLFKYVEQPIITKPE